MKAAKISFVLLFSFAQYAHGTIIGITNYITVGEAEGKAVEKIIEREEKKILASLDILTVELKAKLDASKERYRILVGIKMMTKSILREKMRTYDAIRKARRSLELELNEESLKKHAKMESEK